MMLVEIMGLDKCSYFFVQSSLKMGRTMLPNDEATQFGPLDRLHVPEQYRGDSKNQVRAGAGQPIPIPTRNEAKLGVNLGKHKGDSNRLPSPV